MIINRDRYLNKLISYMWNGQIKIITGIRRCGKSYLLNTLFKNYLLDNNVLNENIISIQLDLIKDIKYRNPLILNNYIKEYIKDNNKYYLFIDEIQMSETIDNPYLNNGSKITFYDVLNELREIKNLDVYITGSNSKMLSSDILTNFRGRYDEIKVHPLSFKEYYNSLKIDKREAFENYSYYGGMPYTLNLKDDNQIIDYLNNLFNETYLKDIVERNNILKEDVLNNITDLLCSSIGSLTNPNNITNALNSSQSRSNINLVSVNTVSSYINYLKDSFLINECKRYDIKGKAYFSYPNKYYLEDIGLRNARINFRQLEPTHIMENIIYNELIIRGFKVDVGVVYNHQIASDGKLKHIPREIDFIANKGNNKYYIQSAFAIETPEKKEIENKPFILLKDSFPKIIIRNDIYKKWYDDNGILNINILDFLLDDDII